MANSIFPIAETSIRWTAMAVRFGARTAMAVHFGARTAMAVHGWPGRPWPAVCVLHERTY